MEERLRGGEFTGFSDLVERVDGKAVNKRVLESLIKTGGFDALHTKPSRSSCRSRSSDGRSPTKAPKTERRTGKSFFDMMAGDEEESDQKENFGPNSNQLVPEIDKFQKLKFEKELLGFFLSGHPVDTMLGLGPLVDSIHPDEFANLSEKISFRLCGVVSEIERRYTKKDSKPWARFTLLAKAKDISLPMFPEAYMNFGDRLHEGELAVITGVASVKDGETRLTVDKVESIDESLAKIIEESTWLIDPTDEDAAKFLTDLHRESERGRGRSRVSYWFCRRWSGGWYGCANG